MSTSTQAYLDGTDTESEPFEDPVETKTLEPPLTVAPPTSLPESTSSTLVPILRRTTRMAVRVLPAMSPSLYASMEEVSAMSESAFCKRYRSSYESSPSFSSPDLPSRKCYRGDDGLAAGDEGRYGREKEEAVVEGHQQAVLVMGTAVSAPLGLGYGVFRRRELALEEDHVYSTFETGHGSRSAPDSKRPERISVFKQPTLTTWTDPEEGMVYIDVPAYPPPTPPVQTPPSSEWTSSSRDAKGLICDHTIRLEELSLALFERYDRDIGKLFTRSGPVRDEIYSQRYRFLSLKHEQKRVAVTSGALWRPVLALESWAGQTDAQRAALWHAINDTQGENQELRF
uniref:Uncharacterized protein n=1 Tax=Tanacetum cinerariifolium TaxID=118510 RepID=A0A699IME0_TANCI|nr:hypothetical protein [Tanacetum cinerariifolium]